MRETGSVKPPFAIDVALQRVAAAIGAVPKAALFELAEHGFDSPFEQLIACIVSIRTRDEVTLPCARRLFALARTPAALAWLDIAVIDQAIATSTFHQAKAAQIHAIARRIESDYGGILPCSETVLRSFRGVGPKCANLVLGIACGEPRIGVDTHVHRVTNRWGYVQGKTPEQTLAALEAKLPKPYWVEINRLLVPFGKHICTYPLPRCSICPLSEMCEQIGVRNWR